MTIRLLAAVSVAFVCSVQPALGQSAACTTADPFVSLGGGTCCQGGWRPPGMACEVTPTLPPPTPPSGAACTTPDPFVSLGGGFCCNGGWRPQGMTCPSTPAPPPPGSACTTGDPFVSLGGGTCCNDGWLPPGMACATTPPLPDTGSCAILLMEPQQNGSLIMSVSGPAEGGAVVVWTLVDPPFSCSWSAFPEVSWITVTSPAFPEFAQGDGEVRFTLQPNDSGVERTGRIKVAEKFLTVVQPPR